MARLIDADWLEKELQRYTDAEEAKSVTNTGGGIMSWEHRQVLMAVNAVSVAFKTVMDCATIVEFVRCKDCRFFRIADFAKITAGRGFCVKIDCGVNRDDFCSFGKQKKTKQ